MQSNYWYWDWRNGKPFENLGKFRKIGFEPLQVIYEIELFLENFLEIGQLLLGQKNSCVKTLDQLKNLHYIINLVLQIYFTDIFK